MAFGQQTQTSSTTELFYKLEQDQYLYMLNYGVVILGNYKPTERAAFLNTLSPYLNNPLNEHFEEEFMLEQDDHVEKPAITPQAILLPKGSEPTQIVRLAMLNTGQSVALDYYETLTYKILGETSNYTTQLEQLGRIKMSKKNLLKFIGRALNIKNSIVDNLYILDEPGMVWDDPELDRINRSLKETFDIQLRFRDLDYKLRIVEDNMKFFSDLLQHRESARLEWIIIILILIEVINVFFHEIF